MTPPLRRTWLVVCYVLCAAAGATSLLWHSPAVATTGAWAYAWGVLLILGGTAAAVGVARDHWLGEWCGLPPLVAVWAVYSGTLAWLALDDTTRVPGCLALAAVAALMFWRWQVVAVERTAARQQLQRDRG